MSYANFRTGMTFAEVFWGLYYEFKSHYEATGEVKVITRHTVLGRWRQIKLEMWDAYRRGEIGEAA